MKHGEVYSIPSDLDIGVSVPLIGINYCHANYRNVRGRSDITVLAYVLRGQGRIRVDSATHLPREGDVFILRKGSYHEVTAMPDQEGYWTYLWYNLHGNSDELLSAYQLKEKAHIPNAPLEDMFRKGFRLVKRNRRTNAEQAQTGIQLVCTEILIALTRLLKGRNLMLSEQTMRVKHYLDHLAGPFDSELLSRQMAMSYKQLNRLFKKETGTTIYHYLLSRKIAQAEMMLKDTSMTVSEIAFHLGYEDPHYFSNLFKLKTGTSPTAFRQRSAQS
ncbi:AraC family transcriptional regulator [Paenibacillus arenilitoris]|uniref:Helix-turn-helix transcriptional regulator n=1 Tax=Paenibacillus arenilitoris TaxID=2772299 RepID=A0A927CGL5_9BACL|nr:AraC family transcriptional regulator [Paenibacillus arenilitoris]MBD2867180.1 helix-turn-helix transcriptional regulator [Paenibacillus arenilitoris]